MEKMQKTKNDKNTISKQIEDNSYKRYVLSVVSWQEEIIIKNLKERIKKHNLWKDIIDFLNPIINSYSIKKWQKITKHKKLYPWYIFIKSRMNDKIRYVVRNTPWVRIIVWAKTHPVPLTDHEFNAMMKQIENSKKREKLDIPFQKWDLIELKAWDFKWMKWLVRAIDTEKWLVIVNVEMLWRITPVAIETDKISLIN